MVRGTFANIRIKNEMMGGKEGGNTIYYSDEQPSGEEMSIFDAAMRYQKDGVPAVVIGGKEYGTGSSRDWAAKGPKLLGVRAVITESFERIHRSNLIGMGVAPFVFEAGKTRNDYALTGRETIDIPGLSGKIKPRMKVTATIHYPDGRTARAAAAPDDPDGGRSRLFRERRHSALRAAQSRGGVRKARYSFRAASRPRKGMRRCPVSSHSVRRTLRRL